MQDVCKQAESKCRMLQVTAAVAVMVLFGFANDSNLVGQTTGLPVKHATTLGGVEFGLWNQTSDKPAPVLLVLASTIDTTLGQAYFRQCGNELARQSWISVSIDLPCHGKQAREGEPSGLGGWSYRLAKDEDIVYQCINEALRFLPLVANGDWQQAMTELNGFRVEE